MVNLAPSEFLSDALEEAKRRKGEDGKDKEKEKEGEEKGGKGEKGKEEGEEGNGDGEEYLNGQRLESELEESFLQRGADSQTAAPCRGRVNLMLVGGSQSVLLGTIAPAATGGDIQVLCELWATAQTQRSEQRWQTRQGQIRRLFVVVSREPTFRSSKGGGFARCGNHWVIRLTWKTPSKRLGGHIASLCESCRALNDKCSDDRGSWPHHSRFPSLLRERRAHAHSHENRSLGDCSHRATCLRKGWSTVDRQFDALERTWGVSLASFLESSQASAEALPSEWRFGWRVSTEDLQVGLVRLGFLGRNSDLRLRSQLIMVSSAFCRSPWCHEAKCGQFHSLWRVIWYLERLGYIALAEAIEVAKEKRTSVSRGQRKRLRRQWQQPLPRGDEDGS